VPLTTPTRNNPFPERADPPHGWAQIQALAEALDDAPRLSSGSLAGRAGHTGKRFYEQTDASFRRLAYNNGQGWIEIPRFKAGNLSDRPAANLAGAGSIWADQDDVHWRSNGTGWVFAGGTMPRCVLGLAANFPVANSTTVEVPWTSEQEDITATPMHVSGAVAVTTPYDGLYSAVFTAVYEANSAGDRAASVYQSTALVGFATTRPKSELEATAVQAVMPPMSLSAGTTIRAKARQTSGTELDLLYSLGTSLSVVLLGS
jgi:hypothetical protein